MPSIGQVYYNVLDTSSGEYISSGIDIFSNIITAYGATEVTKVGIQAPSGTRVVMNETRTIMIGRTGIYELDDNINITSLYFVRPRKYVKDEYATQQALAQGTAGMTAADSARAQALEQFEAQYPTQPSQGDDNYQEYWDAYNAIQTTYITAYEEALNLYNQGVNGVYVLPNPSDPEADENFQDLYNVIVDFVFD